MLCQLVVEQIERYYKNAYASVVAGDDDEGKTDEGA